MDWSVTWTICNPDCIYIFFHYCFQVQTPVLLLLGADDKRVPNKQGIEFYRALKTRQLPVRWDSCPLECQADIAAAVRVVLKLASHVPCVSVGCCGTQETTTLFPTWMQSRMALWTLLYGSSSTWRSDHGQVSGSSPKPKKPPNTEIMSVLGAVTFHSKFTKWFLKVRLMILKHTGDQTRLSQTVDKS